MNNGKNRILVADGERVYAKALQSFLMIHGYEVLVAQDGQTAIELTARQKPNLILLGADIPGIGGYEVCQRIREFSTVPIIMFSTLVRKTNIVKGLNAGANDCVARFFNIEEFLTKIQAAVRPIG